MSYLADQLIYMKKFYPSLILGFIFLISVKQTIKADTLNDPPVSENLLSPDTLLQAKLSVRKSSYQLGIQIENVIRTGYSNQMTYEYKPVLIQFEFQKALSRKEIRGWRFDYFIQPQFNMVRFSEAGKKSFGSEMFKSWEAGVNVGVVLLKPLMRLSPAGKINVYFLGSLGPHYVSSSPSRQAKGFLFSDNLRVGLRVPVTQFVQIDLRTGIRHLSNASLKRPNGGLDDVMFGAGIRFVKP